MKIFFKFNTFCLSILSALLLVCFEVKYWALAFSLGLLVVRFGAERKFWPLPHRFWTNFLALVALGLVLFEYRTFLGQEASSTFLVLLSTVRILDYRSERDKKLLVLVGFVLVSLKFLYSLDLYWLPAGITVFLGLWRSLLPSEVERPWKMTFRIVARSLPVVIILFLVFPRVQVPWMPAQSKPLEMVGFSESISPGDIASLAKNHETVMRVEFLNFKPRTMDLYWRGAVLDDTDGFKWKRSPVSKEIVAIPSGRIAYDYIVTLEPLQMKAIPVLEHTKMISSPNLEAFKTDRAVFRASDPIQTRIRYQGQSSDSWSGAAAEDPLKLPNDLPEKTLAWIQEKKKLKLDLRSKLKLIKDFFQEGQFVYTLSPGSHKNLDEFLFDRRVGFCEHFASAFAILARGLGIPARVVTGYQGGEWNNAGDFIRVTQADAHAWVEVRDPNGAWRRVDPTSWIAPLRIELGGITYFQLTPSELNLKAYEALNRIRNRDRMAIIWDTLQSQVETMNYMWTRTMLEFDLSEQQKLLQFFAPQIGWWLTSLVALFILYQVFRRWQRKQKGTQIPAVFYFNWLERKLAQLGHPRPLHQAPVEYLKFVAQSRTEDSDILEKTIKLFQFERYKERSSGPDDWKRLKREWERRLKRSTLKDKFGSR